MLWCFTPKSYFSYFVLLGKCLTIFCCFLKIYIHVHNTLGSYLSHSLISPLSSTGNIPHLKSYSLYFYDLEKNPSPSNERTHLIPVFLRLIYLVSQDGLQFFRFTSLPTHHLIFSYLHSGCF